MTKRFNQGDSTQTHTDTPTHTPIDKHNGSSHNWTHRADRDLLSHNLLKGEVRKVRQECGRVRSRSDRKRTETDKEKGEGVNTRFKSRKVRRCSSYRK